MNLKEMLETKLGTISGLIFGKAVAAYFEQFKVFPMDDMSIETLDWLTNYILQGRELR
jgi:hypothetical protein